MKPHQDVYTFGDNELAGMRLRRLAEVFEPSLLDLVRRQGVVSPAHVLDFGCGPGYTTRALWTALRPEQATGLDRSAAFLELARRDSPSGIRYVQQDLTEVPVGVGSADFAYARFLLTHLSVPADALRAWAPVLRPGARLVIQETAEIGSDQPDLARYYELVLEFQRAHDQRLNVGADLDGVADERLYRVLDYGVRPLELPAHRMAELHAMNIATWRRDPLAARFDPAELSRVHAALEQLSREPDAGSVRYAMGELVLERRA